MEKSIEKILICPNCKHQLEKKLPQFKCPECGNIIETVGPGVPVFIDFLEENIVKELKKKKGKSRKLLGKILKAPHHSIQGSFRDSYLEGEELIAFLKKMPKQKLIVNIGSLSRSLREIHPDVVNLDIAYYPNVDIVANAEKLPFKDNSVDMIICVNVIEHIKRMDTALAEIFRVLKHGGFFYVKIPFLQPFHAVPDDYRRFTKSGIEELLKNYHALNTGIAVGGGSMLAWILREYLAILTSFGNNFLYKLGWNFWGWLTFWLKYSDLLLKNNKFAARIASAFYGLYQKPY